MANKFALIICALSLTSQVSAQSFSFSFDIEIPFEATEVGVINAPVIAAAEDVLGFTFADGDANVYKMPDIQSFLTCDFTNAEFIGDVSPAEYVVTSEDSGNLLYFASDIIPAFEFVPPEIALPEGFLPPALVAPETAGVRRNLLQAGGGGDFGTPEDFVPPGDEDAVDELAEEEEVEPVRRKLLQAGGGGFNPPDEGFIPPEDEDEASLVVPPEEEEVAPAARLRASRRKLDDGDMEDHGVDEVSRRKLLQAGGGFGGDLGDLVPFQIGCVNGIRQIVFVR